MTGMFLPSLRRVALLSSAAAFVFGLHASAAWAGDLPATPDGAAKVAAAFKTYGGVDADVKADGKAYLVSYAFTAPASLMGSAQTLKFDPIKVDLKIFAQDDGGWRVEVAGLPPITAKGTIDGDPVAETVTLSGFKKSVVYDPAIFGPRSGGFSADKVLIAVTSPRLNENVEVSGFKGSVTGAAGAGGTLTTAVHESGDGFTFKLSADPKEPAKPGAAKEPIEVTGKGGATSGDFKADGLKSKALADLWAFMIAHPQRADLAANEPAFKALLTSAAAGTPTFASTFQGDAYAFSTAKGAVTFDKAGGAFGLGENGPQSHFEERFKFSGISLSEGLVPPLYKDIVPTSVDIGVKISGFDLSAAAQEWIADIKLAGDGPWLAKDDSDKVSAKLTGAGPIAIEIPSSHLVSLVLDVTIDGRADYQVGGKPVGKFTIRIRNFDKSVEALNTLGPEAQQKLVPMLAMAKGLGKADGDSLVWVCELGADRVMKVNGLPLGKAPI